jgi:hypothetical protein
VFAPTASITARTERHLMANRSATCAAPYRTRGQTKTRRSGGMEFQLAQRQARDASSKARRPSTPVSGPLFPHCAHEWCRGRSIFRRAHVTAGQREGTHENNAGPSLGIVRRAACRLRRMGLRLVCQIITIPRHNSGHSRTEVGDSNHHPLKFRSSGGGCDNIAWLELPDALLHGAFGRWAVHRDFQAPGLCFEHRFCSTRSRATGRVGSEIRARPDICRTSTVARRKGESHKACKDDGQLRRATEGSSRKPKLVVPPLWLSLTAGLACPGREPGASAGPRF